MLPSVTINPTVRIVATSAPPPAQIHANMNGRQRDSAVATSTVLSWSALRSGLTASQASIRYISEFSLCV